MDLRYKNLKREKRSRKTKQRKMKGGAARSCLSQYTGGVVPSVCGSANVHNTNPQAMGDLDNKFNLYGGPVPLGENLVGGGGCGDEGVNTTGIKNSTFKQYVENMSKNLDLQMGGVGDPLAAALVSKNGQMHVVKVQGEGPNPLPIELGTIRGRKPPKYGEPPKEGEEGEPREPQAKKPHSGGGYIVDPSQYIGGMPRIGHYDDCCPPAIVGGKILQAGPDQRVCGLGALPPMTGGKRKHTKKNKSKKSKKSNKQRGGDFTSVGRSKPATMSDAFSGQPSYFDDGVDLSKRHFEEVQPNYGPLAM